MIEVLLWLFVINLGIAFGAGLYESRIVVPQWLSFSRDTGYRWNAEAARKADVGLRFWVYVTTLPLTPVDVREFDNRLVGTRVSFEIGGLLLLLLLSIG